MVRSARTIVVVEVGCSLAVGLMFVNSLAGGSDLRTGVVPIAAGLLALCVGLAVLVAGQKGLGLPRRLAYILSVFTASGLLAVSGFFFALALLSALGSNLLSADTALTSFGTLLASVLTFIFVPAGMVLFGYCLMRERKLPLSLRGEPWVMVVLLLGGGAVLAALPEGEELWLQFGWFTIIAGLIAHFAAQVSARGSEPATTVQTAQ